VQNKPDGGGRGGGGGGWVGGRLDVIASTEFEFCVEQVKNIPCAAGVRATTQWLRRFQPGSETARPFRIGSLRPPRNRFAVVRWLEAACDNDYSSVQRSIGGGDIRHFNRRSRKQRMLWTHKSWCKEKRRTRKASAERNGQHHDPRPAVRTQTPPPPLGLGGPIKLRTGISASPLRVGCPRPRPTEPMAERMQTPTSERIGHGGDGVFLATHHSRHDQRTGPAQRRNPAGKTAAG